jgi:hypothetical protein
MLWVVKTIQEEYAMLAMQYVITLPADYDMGIVRNRVATRGSAFDTQPHLGFKAFLISEKGKYGSRENSYAPFYLWREHEGMHDFFYSEKFQGLYESFGWPAVRTWSVLDAVIGKREAQPAWATRELMQIEPYTNLPELRSRELALQQEMIQAPHVHSHVVAFDPYTWTLVRFTLLDKLDDSAFQRPEMQCYEVLHLSAPVLANKTLLHDI